MNIFKQVKFKEEYTYFSKPFQKGKRSKIALTSLDVTTNFNVEPIFTSAGPVALQPSINEVKPESKAIITFETEDGKTATCTITGTIEWGKT